MKPLLKAALAGALLLPLAACFSYSEVPVNRPQPVVVNPPPPGSGAVVVQPGTAPATTY